MDVMWMQTFATMGTVVLAMVGVLGLARRAFNDLRTQNREAHGQIGAEIAKLRDHVGAEIAGVRSEIAEVRRDGSALREELAEFKGEMRSEIKALYAALLTLREDFRTRVYGRG